MKDAKDIKENKDKKSSFCFLNFGWNCYDDIACIYTKQFFDSKHSIIELLYYNSQIVSSIFVVTGVVIAGWQYYLSSKSAIVQMDIERVQRAIDLAEYYKDNILEKYGPIKLVYEESGVLEILNDVKKDEFKRFDMMEAEQILSDNSIKKLKDLQNTPKFTQAVLEASKIYDFGIDFKSLMEIKDIKSEDNKMIVTIDTTKLIMHFMKDYVNDILNNIEFLPCIFHMVRLMPLWFINHYIRVI